MTSINIVYITVVVVALHREFSVVQNAVITRNEDIHYSFNGICLTTDCIRQAAFFINNMDQNVDPCDDFYKFTCGNFIRKNLIPQDKSDISSFTSIQDGLTNDLLDGLHMEIQADDLEALKKMKIHYQNCLNEFRIEEEGLEPYLDILKKSGGWPILMGNSWNEESYTWEGTLVKLLFLGLPAGFPFYLSIHRNSRNETNNIFHLYPAITIIHNETKLYLENNKTLNAYHDYILDIAVMLGANKTAGYKESKDLLDFEIDLLKLKIMHEERENISIKQQRTVFELNKQFPGIQWLELLNSISKLGNVTINESDLIEILDINYLIKLEDLLSRNSKRTLANYQIWQVLSGIIHLMPKKFVMRKTIYTNIISDANTNKLSRDIQCLNAVKESLYVAINGLYVRKYFDHEVKKKVVEMAINIRNQFNENFQKSWRSYANTTEEILEKINSMNMFIAYPDELLNDEKLEEYYANLRIEPGLYINSALNTSIFRRRKLYEFLKKPVEKNNWVQHAYITYVNAFYSNENVIGIPAGILHEPFIYVRGPEYLNYGGIGSVIAHEITHGIYRNKQEKVINDTASKHNTDVLQNINQCFIDKYNNYNISEGIAVNGRLTLHENIPDITGFKIAYEVYTEWAKRNNITELNLPGLDDYTPLQMFWISAASNFCRKHKTEYLKQRMQWDQHSPGEARVNVAFSNIDHFAKDFKCKEGFKMNPVMKCKLWETLIP